MASAENPAVVVDGDGLRIGTLRIRLWGIDAPELKQTCDQDNIEYPCGEDARFLLGGLLMGGDLSCKVKDVDRYNRTIAQCSAGGIDLGGEMVRQGYALDWKQYSKGFYKEQEIEAKANKRGIWAGNFTQPWEWRKTKRKK